MSDQVDYDSDVLKFKQVWGDNKNPDQTGLDPKNLQTIESNAKKSKKQPVQPTKKQASQKPREELKTSTKKPVSSSKQQPTKHQQNKKNQQRNPRPDPEHVIEISTKPNQFYTTSFQNEKNNIAQSHLYLDRGTGESLGTNNVWELKKALQEKDYELSMLRVTNSRTEDRVRYLEKQVQKKNQIIAQLRDRERKVIEKNCDLQSKQFNFDYGKAEYENFKNDSRRLLKMLQSTAEYQDFSRFALDDDGVRFLHNVNKDTKTKLDNPPSRNVQSLHFCTCNKAFIPESGLWIPEKAYSFGKQFVKERKGQMSQAELQLLLYELNRIWREREKRIINTYSALKAHEVGKYKRKLQNMSLSKQNREKSLRKFQNENNEQ